MKFIYNDGKLVVGITKYADTPSPRYYSFTPDSKIETITTSSDGIWYNAESRVPLKYNPITCEPQR